MLKAFKEKTICIEAEANVMNNIHIPTYDRKWTSYLLYVEEMGIFIHPGSIKKGFNDKLTSITIMLSFLRS